MASEAALFAIRPVAFGALISEFRDSLQGLSEIIAHFFTGTLDA